MSKKRRVQNKRRQVASEPSLDVLVLPVVNNVRTISALKKIPANHVGSILKKIRATNETIANGDQSHLEDMLLNQAHALEEIFYSCTHKMLSGEYLQQVRAYSDIALKAQKQCRTTITALVELKNPRQTTFVKQQNNAINQQINLENKSTSANELLESRHAAMDNRASLTSIKDNSQLEAVEKIHGGEDRGR
jgi:hypothetical protein